MGCVLGRPGSSGSVSGSRDEVSTRIESNRHQVNNVSVTKTETTESTSAVVVASASNGEEVRNHEDVVDQKKENGFVVTEAKERKSKGERKRSKPPDPRRSNPPKNLLGEQVAAGWPSWLSEVCGEALSGWLPRKADSFEKIDKIGSGTYSNVYKAKDSLTGNIVALKKVRCDVNERESLKFMAREILILRRLDHPNVIKLEGLVTSRMSSSLYLVFRYMDHDLAGLAASPEIKFTEQQVKCYMKQLLSGLEHCHNRGVLHRDIKGSNLLIDDGGVLRIGDFGLATFFDASLKMESQKQEDNEYIFRSLYPSVPIPDKLTLPEFVLQGVEEYTENVAFVEAVTGKAVTYGDVVRDTKRLAKALTSLGLRKGQVMVVVLPNVAEYGIIALGIMSAGGVFSGANPTALVSEIKKQVEASGARGIITDATNYEKVKSLGLPVIVLGEEKIEGAVNWKDLLEAGDKCGDTDNEEILQTDLCALPFSSGTTGLQKGVMLTHRNLIANLCSTLFGVRSEMIGQIVTLGLIPFFHIYGIVGICCATMKNKGKVVAMSRYDLRIFLNALIAHEVSFAPIVPPIILNLVKNPIVDEFDLSKLKLQSVMTAAAPLAPELLTAFEAKFPNVQVQEAYGLTEHSCITLTHGDPEKGQGIAKRNSVGFILPNLEVKFIDPDTGRSLPKNTSGELCVRSQCVMQGYFMNKEETDKTIDEQGWLHTGDIGYIDDDGDIFIVDRIKELIKYKGFQVAPAELEAILLTHPSVEDVAVVPLPDEEAGEIPAACVVINPKATEKEEDILNFVAANVAHYKKVRAVHFVDSIPKSLSGKIMRRLLRDKILSINKK